MHTKQLKVAAQVMIRNTGLRGQDSPSVDRPRLCVYECRHSRHLNRRENMPFSERPAMGKRGRSQGF
jgi:hypothetical protein